jgi:hypothetical protein
MQENKNIPEEQPTENKRPIVASGSKIIYNRHLLQ